VTLKVGKSQRVVTVAPGYVDVVLRSPRAEH